jgi:chemotaxis protein CheD
MLGIADQKNIERRKRSNLDPDDHYQGKNHYFDTVENKTIVKVFAGDWYVTKQPDEMIATILGSCVSACIRDPLLKIGGMNHFMLPGDNNHESNPADSARYGVFAMEMLINGLLKEGANKDRFEIKVFGGGNVINNSARIGSKNAAFIRTFLEKEGFKILVEDMEGDWPRRLNYYPYTGKVKLLYLRRVEDNRVVDEEIRYTKKITTNPVEGGIELF